MAKLSLYILLAALLTTAAATVAAATTEAHLKVMRPHFQDLRPITDLSFPLRFNFTRCWASIAKVEGCATDLVKSITNFEVSVSIDCCKAIIDVSDKCFFIFGGLFAPVLRNHCIIPLPNVRFAETPGSSAWGNEGQ